MNINEEIREAELVRNYEVAKAQLKGTLRLIEIRNQDIEEQIKMIDLARSGEIDTPFRDIIIAILDDLDELEILMAKKKQYETKLNDFVKEEEQTEE